MKKTPEMNEGKYLYYEQIFKSRSYPTEAEAQWKLERVKEFHTPEKGWVELDAHIERTPDGYVAVRHHALYK